MKCYDKVKFDIYMCQYLNIQLWKIHNHKLAQQHDTRKCTPT